MPRKQSQQWMVFVTSFASGPEAAISTCRLEVASGRLECVSKASEVESPFFLAIDPHHRYLYSIHEPGKFGAAAEGRVRSFSIDGRTGTLSLLNEQPTQGGAACYLDVDRSGRFVLAANYGKGSVSVIPVGRDGRLGRPSCFIEHQGSSVNTSRQTGPHAHCVVLDPASRYAVVSDLGLDKVLIYKLDTKRGILRPNVQPFVRVKPGAGPRHFAFHPSGRYAYGINELDNTMTAFRYDAPKGILFEIQALSTLPADFKDTTYCADVKVHPSGKFVYGTNRGHESIAMYGIDRKSGLLSLVGIEPSRGKQPQNLAITPDGSLLLVAHTSSNNVVVFRIDGRTGRLEATGHELQVGHPSCLMLMQPGE
ncbi:MAG: lactonase family protein [Planctomycetes bacterium]|nr:lactonase family protein [Planctomycetota bacterium]